MKISVPKIWKIAWSELTIRRSLLQEYVFAVKDCFCYSQVLLSMSKKELELEQQLLIANFMTFTQTHSISVIKIQLFVFVFCSDGA